MVIKDQLVSDLELRLSKFRPHGDLKISRGLLAFWIDSSRDTVVVPKILQDLGKRNIIDSAFIDKEVLNVAADADSGKYVLTPTNPMIQLPEGRGVVQIIDLGASPNYALIKTDYDEVDVVDNLRYATPALTRLFWYQDHNDNIVIHPADATSTQDFLLRYVRADWGSDTALSAAYPISSDLYDPLMELAYQKAVSAIQLGQVDVLTNEIPAE